MTKMPSPAKDASACSLAMLPELGELADENDENDEDSGVVSTCCRRGARVIRKVGGSGSVKHVNLFEARRLRGFWPCYNDESGVPVIAVRHDMTELHHLLSTYLHKRCSLESALLVYCTVQGKIEMELELLTAEEAAAKPAGRSRDEPNQNPMLLEPKCARPAPPVASGHLSSTRFSVLYILYIRVCIRVSMYESVVGRQSRSSRSLRHSGRFGTLFGRASSGLSSAARVSYYLCSSSFSSSTRFRFAKEFY